MKEVNKMSKNKLKRVNYSSPQPTYVSKQRPTPPGRVLNAKSIATTNLNVMSTLFIIMILMRVVEYILAGGLGILMLAMLAPFFGYILVIYLFTDYVCKFCMERFVFSKKKRYLVISIFGALLGMVLMTTFLNSQAFGKLTPLFLLVCYGLKLGVIIEDIVLLIKKS